MNNKLIKVLIILICFNYNFPMYFQRKEDFKIYNYPNGLINEHVNFINSNSNQYSEIFDIFNKISRFSFSNI